MSSRNNQTGTGYLLYFASAGMELAWLLAAFILALNLAGVPPLFLLQAIAAFILAALLTSFTGKSGLRIIFRIGLHLFAMTALLLSTLDTVTAYFRNDSPKITAILDRVSAGPQTNLEGLGWALAFIIILTMHISGTSLARRELSYRNITTRFDIGITAFIFLFIIAGALNSNVLPALNLMFAFFVFSLPAIAMARYRQAGTKSAFILRYRGSGPILIFTVFVLSTGSGIALLFYPFLFQAAQAGHSALGQYGQPLVDLFTRIVLFLFKRRSRMDEQPSSSITGTDYIDALPSGNGQAGFMENIFLWGMIILVASVVLIGLYFGLRFFLRWLISGAKDDSGEQHLSPGVVLLRLLQNIVYRCRAAAAWFKATASRHKRFEAGDATYLFRQLLAWGAKSGRPRRQNETPLEYSESLKELFPVLEKEIILIAHNFNREIYGSLAPGPGQKKILFRAWRRLLHPVFWPARFRTRLVGPGKN